MRVRARASSQWEGWVAVVLREDAFPCGVGARADSVVCGRGWRVRMRLDVRRAAPGVASRTRTRGTARAVARRAVVRRAVRPWAAAAASSRRRRSRAHRREGGSGTWRHGVAGWVHGIAGWVHRVAGWVHRVAGWVHRVAGWVHGIAAGSVEGGGGRHQPSAQVPRPAQSFQHQRLLCCAHAWPE